MPVLVRRPPSTTDLTVLRAVVLAAVAVLVAWLGLPAAALAWPVHRNAPPPAGGYFTLRPAGAQQELPGDRSCAGQVHRSTWEPRPDNTKRNHATVDRWDVHDAFADRPIAVDGAADPRWDSWLLARVDGQFAGTTDQIFQWAACKWGLPDNLLRSVAYQESTWFQYETYPSGRPALTWGSGDMMPAGTAGADVYCDAVADHGYDYQDDFGPAICPQTFSIFGIKSWRSPSWGPMPENQNGTFPFNRDSTAFAADYLGSQLRGCYNGWETWLAPTGTKTYAAGDLWGCVGAWYSGDWHSAAADKYLAQVQTAESDHVWLTAAFAATRPPCDPVLGCPGPDDLCPGWDQRAASTSR